MKTRRGALYNKYKIEKTDGTPIDPEAQYFVLRIDTDVHARTALRAYAHSLAKFKVNPELEKDLWRYLEETIHTPAAIEEEEAR